MIGLASDQVDGFGDVQRITAFMDSGPVGGDYPYVGSWAEFNDLNPGVNSIDIRSKTGGLDVTPVDIIPQPAAGRQRQVKYIGIRNTDGIVNTVNVVIESSVSSTAATIRITLDPGDSLHYNDTRGWYVLNDTGAIKTNVIDSTPVPAGQTTSKLNLSGSTNGRPIAVAATATPGTVIHTAASSGIDEVWLWVNNRTATAAALTTEWGGTANSDHTVEALSIPANSGPVLIADGLRISNSLVIRAFSGTGSALNIAGFVNRIT